MAYVVTQTLMDNGKMLDAYSRSFDTLDEANDYYDDIDLEQEYSVEYMCSPYGSWMNKVLQKELYDEHGTLDKLDFYDYDRYKGVKNGS